MANYTTDIHSYYQALQFDGVDDIAYVQLANLPNAYTIELWVRTTQAPASISGFSDSPTGATSQEKNFYLTASGTVIFRGYDSSDKLTTSTTAINDGEWHHIAASAIDGGQMKLYVDGVLEDLTAIGTLYTGYSTAYFTFGFENKIDTYMNGSIDEVRVWNVERTEAQIQANIDSPLSDDDKTGLVVYFPLNEGLGNVPYDHSGNGNHGTISGATWTSNVGMKRILKTGLEPTDEITSFSGADNVYEIGNYKYYVYSTTGSQTIDVTVANEGLGAFDAFVVGGGGSGTGAGGGGGYVNTFEQLVTPTAQFEVTVGNGAPTPPDETSGIDGEFSQIINAEFRSNGGGGALNTLDGGHGGSGGGAYGSSNGTAGDGGSNGGNGGNGTGGTVGGAGQGPTTYAFDDQNLAIGWIAAGTKFGAGGGGGTFDSGTNGLGGDTGGGDGIYAATDVTLANADPFYGGGGGGRGNTPGTGGAGGSGIVILRHEFTAPAQDPIDTAIDFSASANDYINFGNPA